MKIKIVIIMLVVAALLPASAAAFNESQIKNTKYIGIDTNYNVHLFSVDVTLKSPGKMVYVENFYSVDSRGSPKFFSSRRVDAGSVAGSITMNIERPKHRYGGSYQYVEKLIITDGKVSERVWLDYVPYW